jgi:hypothetical protein
MRSAAETPGHIVGEGQKQHRDRTGATASTFDDSCEEANGRTLALLDSERIGV